MSVLDWVLFGLAVVLVLDALFVVFLVKAADLRERARQAQEEIPPFPYAEALGFVRGRQTRRAA